MRLTNGGHRGDRVRADLVSQLRTQSANLWRETSQPFFGGQCSVESPRALKYERTEEQARIED